MGGKVRVRQREEEKQQQCFSCAAQAAGATRREGVGVGGAGPAEGGVASGPLMNQCQRSDEKIIKKQAGAVLNTAKGKRPIPLYGNTIWTRARSRNKWGEGENEGGWGGVGGARRAGWVVGGAGLKGGGIHIVTDAKMPFRWHYEGRQYK